MSLLENVTLHMELDNSDFKREFKDATTVVNKQMDALTLGASAFSAKWEDITSNLRSFKRVASGLAISAGIYAVTGAIAGASEAILTFRNNLEASEISMSYFAQDALQAKEYIRELEDFAASTPFSTESAISMAQYLQAMSVPINNSKSMLKVISDTAAATGATEENMQRIVTALGQILTKGKLAAEEVRQLANANIPIYNILKEQLKLTGQEIKNLGNLNINASKAVVAILDGLKERYEGAADRIADTLGGMTETIKDDALIISEAFFHGSLDRLEDKITVIRDKLDSWRDIGLHYGTGGMIQAIIGDIDPDGSKHLEDFIISAVAGFKNLGDTVHEFVTKNGTALTVFTKTAYTGIMSLTIAADYLLRVFNKVQDVGDAVIEKINKLTGMSLELSDVVAGLLVFRTVGKTIYFAGNTALWAGKQFLNLGTAIANMLPMMASASAFSRGLVSGLLTLGAAATTAYFGLKAIQGATGVTEGSSLISEDYKQQMEEYNNALNKYTDSLNEDYSAIADNWAAEMSGALDDTEKKAKKTAKKIEKTWLMSFDEVFQIREDPVSKAVDDSLKLFEDINWGDFFTLPEFRFPKELDDALTQPAYSLADAIDTAQDQVGLLNTLLPAVISGVGLVGTILKNRRDAVEKARKAGVDDEALMSDKERAAKLDAETKAVNEFDETMQKASKTVNKDIKAADEVFSEQIKATSERLNAEYEVADATRAAAKKLAGATEQTNIASAALDAAKQAEIEAYKKEIPNIASSVEYIKHGVKKLNSDVDSVIKHSIAAGKDTIINAPGIAAGQTAEINAGIHNSIKEIIPAYSRLVETTSDILTLGKKANFLKNLEEIYAINDRISVLQLKANRLTDAFISQLKPIVSKVVKQTGINPSVLTPDSLSVLLTEAYKTQHRMLIASARQLLSTSAEEVAVGLGDTLRPTFLSTNKAIADIRDMAARLGVVIESSDEAREVNQLLLAIGEVSNPAKKLADLITKRETILSARAATGNVNYGAGELDTLNNAIQTETEALRNSLTLVDALDSTTKSAEANLKSINDLTDKAAKLATNVIDGEHVRRTLQAVNDTLDFLRTSPAAYSVKTSITREYLTAQLDDLRATVSALPSNSLTKDESKKIIEKALEAIGEREPSANGSLTDAFNAYKSAITTAITDKADSIMSTATEISERLGKGAAITETQFNNVQNKVALIAKRLEHARTFDVSSISSSAAYSAVKNRDIMLQAIDKRLADGVQIKANREFLNNFAKIIKESATADDVTLANRLNALIGATPSTLFYKDLKNGIYSFLDDLKTQANIQITIPDVYSLSGAVTGIPGRSAEDYKLLQIVDEIVDTDANNEALQKIVDNFYNDLKGAGFFNAEDFMQSELNSGLLTNIMEATQRTGDWVEATNAMITPFTENVSDSMVELATALRNTTTYEQATDLISLYNSRLKQAKDLKDAALNDITEYIDTKIKPAIAEARAGINPPEGARYARISDAEAAELANTMYLKFERKLDGIHEAAEAVRETSESNYKALGRLYGTFSPWPRDIDIPGATGGYSADDITKALLSDNFFKDFIGRDNYFKNPLGGADAVRKLLGLENGLTKSGASYTDTIATITGKVGKELTVELVEQFESEFNMAAGAVLNLLSTKSITDTYGPMYRGANIAELTGIVDTRLAGILKLGEKYVGVIQSSVVSAHNPFLYSYLDTIAKEGTREVTLVEFLTKAAAAAPDVAHNVMNAFIASPKLERLLVSVMNAQTPILSTGDSLYKLAFDRLFTFLKQQSGGMTISEISRAVKESASEILVGMNIPSDTIDKARRDVFITANDAASIETIRNYVKQINTQQAEELKNSLTIARVAEQHKVMLDMQQHTVAGRTANPGARFARKAAENQLISIRAQLDEYTEEALLASGITTDTLKQIDKLLTDVAEYTLKSGDIAGALKILNEINEGISSGSLNLLKVIAKSTDVEAAAEKFVTHEIHIANLSGTLKPAIEEAIYTTTDAYQKYYASLLSAWYVEYNDYASQIYAAINNLRNAGMLTGGQTGSLQGLLTEYGDTINKLIRTAQKIETAEGFAPTSSAAALKMTNGDAYAFLKNFEKGIDPLLFENSTQANARWLQNIADQTGKKLDTIFGVDTWARMQKYTNVETVVPDTATNASNTPSIPRFNTLETNDIIEMTAKMDEAIEAAGNAAEGVEDTFKAVDVDFDAVEAYLKQALTDTTSTDVDDVIKKISEYASRIDAATEIPMDSIDEVLESFVNDLSSSSSKFMGIFEPLSRITGTDIKNFFKDIFINIKSGAVDAATAFTDGIKNSTIFANIGDALKKAGSDIWHDLNVPLFGATAPGYTSTTVYSSLDDFFSKNNFSEELKNSVNSMLGPEGVYSVNEGLRRNAAYAANGGTALTAKEVEELIGKVAMLQTNGVPFGAPTLNGITGQAWYDAIIDEYTREILKNNISADDMLGFNMLRDEFKKNFFGQDAFKDLTGADKNAFWRGEGIGDTGLKSTEEEIRKFAQGLYGDDFEKYDDILKAINDPDYIKGNWLDRLKVGFARTMENPFVNKMLVPNDIGISGLDAVFALKQSIDALSTGFEEYERLEASNYALTGFDIKSLDAHGNIDDDRNLVNIGDALQVGLQSLAVEGILTNAVQGAAAGTIGGIPGAIAGIVAALATNIGMMLTGAYNPANVASEEIKEMLNNTTWVKEQVKAQGGTDKQAHQAQLDVARQMYLDYYNNMSSIWSMRDKGDIQSIYQHGSYIDSSPTSPTAYRVAVEEMLGRADVFGRYVKDGHVTSDGKDNLTRAIDADKLEQQMYTLFSTGGWDKIMNKAGKYTQLEEDWLYRVESIDDYTKAQLEDYYVLYTDAVKYISEHTNLEIQSLLSAYELPSDTMQDMVEGIVAIYKMGMEVLGTKLELKAQALLSGDIMGVDLTTLATGSGVTSRVLDGDLSAVSQQALDALADATGLYISSISDSMYALSYDVAEVRDKMTGFTVSFPDKIQVGTDTLEVQSIASDTKAVEILQGMGIHINADGGVTVSTEAINSNESGHKRTMDYDAKDISAYERELLRSVGIDLSRGNKEGTGISLDEAAMQNAIAGLTYNLFGVDLQDVATATVDALKAKGIVLGQNQETGATNATITDTSFITGARDIKELINSLDTDTIKRIAPNLKNALIGIDAINDFGASHGESRVGSAAGVEVRTGLGTNGYSATLAAALEASGVTLKNAKSVDAEGNETEEVYAAVNNVGEQWHKAITQWRTGDIKPEMEAFLKELGADVEKHGGYTMVSTEKIIERLASGSSAGLRQILFDNAELWDQFPEDTKQAFIAAGLATEDGFIKLEGEVLDGWYRYEVNGKEALTKAFSAMENDMLMRYAAMQGTTVLQWGQLNEEQKVALEALGITTQEQYGKYSDELLTLITSGNGLVKDGVVTGWNDLTESQRTALEALGITTEEQYNEHYRAMYTIGSTGFGILNEDTILGWDALDGTTKAKLAAMGITTEQQYDDYLKSMGVKTGQGLSTVDETTRLKLLKIGNTTAGGWANVTEVTDKNLTETEHKALGHMKFEDLPQTIKDALGDQGIKGNLHDSWWAINEDAKTQLGVFSDTVDGMAADLDRVKDLAQQLKQALADPALQAETLNANLAATAATALEAAKSSSNKWAQTGGQSHTNGFADSDKWKNWDDDIMIIGQQIGISEYHTDSMGNPMVYYIYNLDVDGTPGQIIKNSDGVWHKYLGDRPYNADNLPGFKTGGIVTGDGLFRAGEFGLNEAIVPLEQPQAMRKIGEALAAAVPTWELVAPLQHMIGARDAGVAQFSSFRSDKAESSVEEIVTRIMDAQAHKAPTTSTSSDDRRPLYVGTLIADKAGLRELDRQMKRVSRQDGGM